MSQFPKQSRWKEYPRENNTWAAKVWENVAQTRLGGEFWACDVIALKTVYNWENSPALFGRERDLIIDKSLSTKKMTQPVTYEKKNFQNLEKEVATFKVNRNC